MQTDRFWSKVDATGDCWEWTAALTAGGYGSFRPPGDVRRTAYAHRYAYERLVGAIPDGSEIDHLCRNTACVNPDHLEPVTHAENVRRGVGGEVAANLRRATEKCFRGHEYTAENTGWRKSGDGRYCRACIRESSKRKRDRIRQARDQSGDSAELTAIEDDWPVVDRLNPGRSASYA